MTVFAENKKAYFDYEILEKFEAGIVLLGKEVKSIQNKRMNISGAHIIVSNQEIWLLGSNIAIYQPTNSYYDYQPDRTRKLMLKKNEILYLQGKIQQKGLTLIPLKLYTKKAKIKVEFALVKGKKLYDKRETLKKRDQERELRSSF